MISRRVQELESVGSMRIYPEYREIAGKRRKCTVHQLNNLSGVLAHLQAAANKSPSPQGRPKLNDLVVYSEFLEGKGITRLEGEGDVVPYTEGAFGILEAAARSRADKEKLINCRYFIKKNDYVDITTATSTKEGAGIMYSSDQRVIQALNGMLKQANDDKQSDLFNDPAPAKMINEYCFFDIYELTREIGLVSNVKENRDNVLRMVERLKDTQFSVDATQSEYWRQRYMPDSRFTKGDYSYITEFYSAEDWYERVDEDGQTTQLMEERYFVVKFHPLIFNAMTSPQLAFISHDSLKRERLDLVHRLNNWVKPTVGVRDKGYGRDHHRYTLDIFHQRVRPSSRLDNFERQFYNVARRQDEMEDQEPHAESVRFQYDEKGKLIPNGVFWLNGYYYQLELNKELAEEIYRKTRTLKKRRLKTYPVITIWRDRHDEIVGDNSAHNLALRRQMQALLEPEE
ncbi:hypothetical protein HBA55_32315 [Pseudomaricurvus alkylphenolicus]|uniref:hypothetical protein n=1 Tax=Pseudomaricurvus alkylphenolicus TaxID=1306991 RepID=UPI00141F50DD|nr:hypothetical protein [Pseudomaricurvus alkylphenolicus]NIB44325.1 hypothetical protein [Pseudomaricurvus alkylphenolicus]